MAFSLVTRGLSQIKGVDLIVVSYIIIGSFGVHGKNTHELKLKANFYTLMHTPQVWYFRINEFLFKLGFSKFNVYFNSLFYSSSPLFFRLWFTDTLVNGWGYVHGKIWVDRPRRESSPAAHYLGLTPRASGRMDLVTS